VTRSTRFHTTRRNTRARAFQFKPQSRDFVCFFKKSVLASRGVRAKRRGFNRAQRALTGHKLRALVLREPPRGRRGRGAGAGVAVWPHTRLRQRQKLPSGADSAMALAACELAEMTDSVSVGS
jgi:hypothetical protein